MEVGGKDLETTESTGMCFLGGFSGIKKKVLNINRGYNQALMEKCHRLWEYSEFSSEIEENIKGGMRREEAIHTAIDTCIEKGILEDILIKQKAEVLHMLLTEYDEKKHMRTLFREGREKGREEGREEHLREQVKKKLDKCKAIPEIAEELEEEISVIQRLIDNSRLGGGNRNP